MLHIKMDHECSNMVVNILPADLIPSPQGVGSKGKNSAFSEHLVMTGHVAYQIKWNHECSKMQAHVLSIRTPSTPEMGSKVKTIFI